MRTVSTCAPSSRRSKNLVVPSWLSSTAVTSGQTMQALAAMRSRQGREMLVMMSKSRAMRCHIHCQICMARNLGSPSSVCVQASSSGRVRLRRLIMLSCRGRGRPGCWLVLRPCLVRKGPPFVYREEEKSTRGFVEGVFLLCVRMAVKVVLCFEPNVTPGPKKSYQDRA